jgi:cytidylate kinase
MTLVTISAAYGAGGSRIGPALAERLGVPFVDRAIPMAVADRLEVSVDEAAEHDAQVAGNWLERILRNFMFGDAGVPIAAPANSISSDDFRRATEDVLLRRAATGRGVILGRGGAIVLRDDPRALRVRLDGPPERRIEQAMRLGGLNRETAESAMRELDRTHHEYIKHFYGVENTNPALYHLVIDSTAIDLAACVDLIALSASALTGRGSARRGVPFEL